MSADLLHENNSVHVSNHHQQPEFIATEVEYDSVIRQKTGTPIIVLDVLCFLPVRLFNFAQPRLNGRLGLSVPGDEVLELLPTVDSHRVDTMDRSL